MLGGKKKNHFFHDENLLCWGLRREKGTKEPNRGMQSRSFKGNFLGMKNLVSVSKSFFVGKQEQGVTKKRGKKKK